MRRTALAIVVTLIAAVAIDLVVSRPGKPSKSGALDALLSFPDGRPCQRPCMLGIEPGVVTPAEALQLIAAHKLTKGATVSRSTYGDRQYLNVNLQDNLLQVQVDYANDQVLALRLISLGMNGLGFTGIVIDDRPIFWRDTEGYFGPPDSIEGASGEGGEITLAAGLYSDGWCVLAPPYERTSVYAPLIIPLDSRLSYLEINCPYLEQLPGHTPP